VNYCYHVHIKIVDRWRDGQTDRKGDYYRVPVFLMQSGKCRALIKLDEVIWPKSCLFDAATTETAALSR